MLTDDQLHGLQRSICEDCDHEIVWAEGCCLHAPGCHAQLMVLFGAADRVAEVLEGLTHEETGTP